MLVISLSLHHQPQITNTSSGDDYNFIEIEARAEVKPVKLAFVGDMMFDRYIRERNSTDEYRNIFSPELTELLKSFDGVIGNLEGPITDFDSVSDYRINNNDHYRFTFSPDILPLLRENNFIALSIGNNHILNFGTEGLEDTKQRLKEYSLGYFGNPYDIENYYKVEINGQTFAFIAENQFDFIDSEEIISLIKSLDEETNHIVIFAHWGEEYEPLANSSQQQIARKYIDSGADLVIGAHPHVIQNKEEFNDKIIFYSLGNFVFDQYFSPQVRCGLIQSFEFTPDKITHYSTHVSYLESDGTTSLDKNNTCNLAETLKN